MALDLVYPRPSVDGDALPFFAEPVAAGFPSPAATLYTILCKCLLSVVAVQAVTELDNKAAHRHAPVPQRHRPFL